MPFARLFVERLPGMGENMRIGGGEAAHARARRLSAGQTVVLFDGSGRETLARVQRVSRAGIEVAADRILEPAAPSPSIALYVGAVRSARLSWIVEKATELSAERLILIRAERTQAFRAGEPLRERLERVALGAAKQCGAARWPRVTGPLSTEEALTGEPARHRLFLDPEGDAFPRALPPGAAALALGPEGGWTPSEKECAHRCGWSLTALPAGRLRTETAAVAGLVLLRAALTHEA